MGGSDDPDEAAGEPADAASLRRLYAGPAPARAAAVLDTDNGGRRAALAAGDGLWLLDEGGAPASSGRDGGWQAAGGAAAACGGGPLAVVSLDFALEPGTGARLLVAGGWAAGAGPVALLSRGAMVGDPAGACDWAARRVPGGGAAGFGTCVVRVDPSEPQRLYALVLPGAPPAGCPDAPAAPAPAPAPAGPEEGGSCGGGDALWVSPDLGETWQLLGPRGGGLPAGAFLCGFALCGTRPGRVLLTGARPALPPGQVPVACGNGNGCSGGGGAPCCSGTPAPPMGPLVLYSCDGGATFADASDAVAAAAEPALEAARARHRRHEAAHPAHAAHCRQRGGPAGAGAALPLFVHATAVVGLADGQLLACADAEAGAPWHAACQLPGPVVALSSDDGLSAPSALPQAPRQGGAGAGAGGGGTAEAAAAAAAALPAARPGSGGAACGAAAGGGAPTGALGSAPMDVGIF
jgi:hypothetical protein